MRGIFLVALLGSLCVQAQSYRDLLLPQPRHMIGVVVDSDGTPVAEARIDHAHVGERAPKTDVAGRFELDTDAPSVVIRKPGYHSKLLRTAEATDVRITLKGLKETALSRPAQREDPIKA
jgi:hypothetical protein